MDSSIALLTQQGMSYQPIAQGYAHHRRYPTEGLPFMSSQLGGLAAMGATPHLQRMMGDVGMVPMGVGHDQNVYDRMMNQRYTMMQLQAMQQASQQDRDNYMKTFRGLAAVSGTPYGADQRRAVQALANNATMMSPMLAEMMPGFLDQMGGSRGSATVMTQRMMDAGRYRLDPLTGRMGMSAESVGAISSQMYQDLFSTQNLPNMRGVTAGQVGSMFQQLQQRGMVGTTASSSFGGMSPGDLDKAMLDPGVADKFRSFDAGKIKSSIKQYVDVIAAMRDIFGDRGKPNAPMNELFAGLEALTMGGMSQIDPGRMSMMVRQTHNLAKQTGVTMEGVMMMQNHAASHAARMGIEPGFAIGATQGALAFGGAYRAQGHGAHTAWGAMSSDQIQQLDSNLRVQAASSNIANRMAVATRMSASVGGFDADSDAGRYVSAIQNGMNEYVAKDGSVRSLMMGDSDFSRMMVGAKTKSGKGAGFSEGDVQTLLGQRDTNREYVERYGMANTVRRMQGADELNPFISNVMQTNLTARFRGALVAQGMSEDAAMTQAEAMAAKISPNITKRIAGMSTEAFADTTQRNAGIAGFIADELKANGMGAALDGMDPERKQNFLIATADRFYGSGNRAIQNSAYAAHGNMQNWHRLHNTKTLNESDRQQLQARFTSQMQEAMAPLGRGSLMQRAVDALQDARPDDPRGAAGIVAQTLGGVRIEDINRSLMPQMQQLNAKRQAVEALQTQIHNTTDPKQRAGLMERLDVLRKELTAQAGHLSKVGEQYGLFTADTLTHDDIVKSFNSTGSATAIANDLTGLRGGFGNQVSKEQIEDFRAQGGKGTDAEVIEAIRDVRRNTPFRASEDAIDSLHKQFPQMTRGEAEELAHMRNRAVRLGISEADVQRYRNANKGKFDGPYGELSAIGDLFAAQANAQFDVSDEEMAATKGTRPTGEQIRAFREKNKMHGSDADIEKEMRRRMIYQRKRRSSAENWDNFWGSVEGGAARESLDMASSDIENVAAKLIGSPQQVQRLGTRGIEISETLRSDQQRLRELAMYHAGGDVSRLMAGDYSRIKAATPEEAKALAAKIGSEVNDIQDRQRAFLSELASTEGAHGRAFQMGNQLDSRRRVVDAEVRAGRMTQADADKIVNASESPAMLNKIESVRRELGSEAYIRKMIGIDVNRTTLTDAERARIAGLRFGAGNEEEARLRYGVEKWDNLSPAERAKVHAEMKVDLTSNAGIEKLVGPQGERDDATYAKHKRWARLGMYNPLVARERMGLGDDALDSNPKLRRLVEQDQEREGNKQEALRLMGKKKRTRFHRRGEREVQETHVRCRYRSARG